MPQPSCMKPKISDSGFVVAFPVGGPNEHRSLHIPFLLFITSRADLEQPRESRRLGILTLRSRHPPHSLFQLANRGIIWKRHTVWVDPVRDSELSPGTPSLLVVTVFVRGNHFDWLNGRRGTQSYSINVTIVCQAYCIFKMMCYV